jgi:hypothetical protein
MIVGALLVAISGVATLRAPVTHAAVVGPGGCTYYHLHDEGHFHTNLCVYGPNYDASGKYYTFTGSCWLTSAAAYQKANNLAVFDFLYQLGCAQQDNVHVYNWLYTYKAFCYTCTPDVPVLLTMSSQRVPAGRTVQIFTNGYSSISVVDGETPHVKFPNPGDGAVTQQYLP